MLTASARLRDAASEARSIVGWALVDLGDSLCRLAHQITRGDTPKSNALTTDHLARIWDATGIAPSQLFRLAEERGTRDALR